VSTYEVEVVAFLNTTYTVVVDASSTQDALDQAEGEVFGIIDPNDIQVSATDARAL
jgi:hypothetical protein